MKTSSEQFEKLERLYYKNLTQFLRGIKRKKEQDKLKEIKERMEREYNEAMNSSDYWDRYSK